jgi:hypothetical protein
MLIIILHNGVNYISIKNRFKVFYVFHSIKDFFVSRVEKNVALPHLFGKELYDVMSEYGDIVFGFQSAKQKFSSFGLTYNWVQQIIL